MTLSNVPNLIPVLSGKGGVGKSSVTVQLALSLCRAGHSVGVLDIDLTGPSIPHLFRIEHAKVRQAPGGWLPVEVHPPYDTEIRGQMSRVGGLYCMSLGFLLRNRGDAVVWRGPKKTAMVGQLLSEVIWPPNISHILIDTPPGTSDEHISLMTQLLDPVKFAQPSAGARRLGAIIVTTPQAISTADVRKELTFCQKVGLKVLGVVENMAGYVCPCCGEVTNVFSKGGGQIMAAEWGVDFLASVPLDGEGWGMLIEEGKRPGYGTQGSDVTDNKKATDRLVELYESCSLCPIYTGIVELLANNEGRIPLCNATG